MAHSRKSESAGSRSPHPRLTAAALELHMQEVARQADKDWLDCWRERRMREKDLVPASLPPSPKRTAYDDEDLGPLTALTSAGSLPHMLDDLVEDAAMPAVVAAGLSGHASAVAMNPALEMARIFASNGHFR
eukprot:gnl/TRDRNA2_/TRDRNA2_187994_c0_seq1.p1 gnl/TRDRNA2_/TRDRNA2_187994_c0~~gnl/TRDRNA2_/TRDRNA2_187994_c0_seq1.p1  ORF type:complete len:132 (-),score=20.63 gnl/TRDRNA2_/TRDRNA2_187994_c0_seq1:91-486(-)